ncbi:MAG: response regulator [Dehalococcoidia bacterium]|nr:response regulator [Dehalococcoidia bacterium]
MTERILVIDDDPSILALVSALLRSAGYEVTSTPDAVEGLRLLLADQPDLVVLDMRMPVMNGWQFSQELKARGISVPIVVMTAAQDARAWAEEIDAAGYIGKPFDIDRLLEEVARAIDPESGSTRLFHLGQTVRDLFPRLTPAARHSSRTTGRGASGARGHTTGHASA